MRIVKVEIDAFGERLEVQGTENYICFSASDIFDYSLKRAIETLKNQEHGQTGTFQVSIEIFGELKGI